MIPHGGSKKVNHSQSSTLGPHIPDNIWEEKEREHDPGQWLQTSVCANTPSPSVIYGKTPTVQLTPLIRPTLGSEGTCTPFQYKLLTPSSGKPHFCFSESPRTSVCCTLSLTLLTINSALTSSRLVFDFHPALRQALSWLVLQGLLWDLRPSLPTSKLSEKQVLSLLWNHRKTGKEVQHWGLSRKVAWYGRLILLQGRRYSRQ